MSVAFAPTEPVQRDYFASHELAPTDENINTMISENKFGRNNYLKHFLCFLDHINYSCSIAIDGQWGCGKSFFVKQAKAVLDCYNPQIKTTDNGIEKSIKLQLEHSFLPIYYDAWANDNSNDPFLSLIHTIATNDNVLTADWLKGQVPFLKKAAAFVDMLCDTNIKEFYELKDADDLLASIKEQKECESNIRAFLDSCKPEKADRIVIFIDELDRCRPSFAVKLLERVKHYFSYDDVTFVLSINSAELEHTIKAFYGQEFDAHRYLDRFFDYRVGLPSISIDDYLSSINIGNNLCYYSVLTAVIRKYKLSIRETEKLCRTLKAVAGNRFAFGHPNSISNLFYGVLLPIIVGLKMTDTNSFQEFIAGNNPQPLTDLCIYSEEVMNSIQNLEIRNGLDIIKVQDSAEVDAFYRVFFSQDSDVLDTYLGVINLLSPYASYH